MADEKPISSPTRLVWIDLEMTGLDVTKQTIVEIATIVTDNDLSDIAVGPNIAINHPDSVLDCMEPWPQKMHNSSGLTQRCKESQISLRDAELQTLAFLKQHCTDGAPPLCGNSIHCDRTFIRFYMPELYAFLDYRIVDVSSFKVIIKRWYPNNPAALFEKKKTHVALEDIRESIEELRHYRQHFFVKP